MVQYRSEGRRKCLVEVSAAVNGKVCRSVEGQSQDWCDKRMPNWGMVDGRLSQGKCKITSGSNAAKNSDREGEGA